MAEYPREIELIGHYNSHPEYYSSNSKVGFDRLGFPESVRTGLDIGCGDGRTCFWLSEDKDLRMTGVDYSPIRIEKASSKGDENCKFVCENIHTFLDNCIENETRFNLVTAFEVLEHLENPSEVFNKILKVADYVYGSIPINHVYVAHLTVFKTIDDIVKLIGNDATFTVNEGHVFFRKKVSY